MAFKDDEVPEIHDLQALEEDLQQPEEQWGAISDDDWDSQAEGEEVISDDDWDSGAEEGQIIEGLGLLNKFNFGVINEPQNSMEEENSLALVKKATKQFEQENIVF